MFWLILLLKRKLNLREGADPGLLLRIKSPKEVLQEIKQIKNKKTPQHPLTQDLSAHQVLSKAERASKTYKSSPNLKFLFSREGTQILIRQ